MRVTSITPQFLEFIPGHLDEGILYISQKYGTAAHKCCCGCGSKIVTPLTPTDWKLSVAGGAATLRPSIGNWNHPCQSHYFIRANCVVWAGKMSRQEIDFGRERDRARKSAHFGNKRRATPSEDRNLPTPKAAGPPHTNWWRSLRSWWDTIFR